MTRQIVLLLLLLICAILLRVNINVAVKSSSTRLSRQLNNRPAPKPAGIFAFDLHSFHYLFLHFQLTLPLIWYWLWFWYCGNKLIDWLIDRDIYARILLQHYLYRLYPPACTLYIHLHVLYTYHADTSTIKAFRICVLIGQPRWPQTNQSKLSYGSF